MTYVQALLIGAAITWPLIAIGIVWFARADKRYQATKKADLQARGLWERDPVPVQYPAQIIRVVQVPADSAEPALLRVRASDQVSAEPVVELPPRPRAITAG